MAEKQTERQEKKRKKKESVLRDVEGFGRGWVKELRYKKLLVRGRVGERVIQIGTNKDKKINR